MKSRLARFLIPRRWLLSRALIALLLRTQFRHQRLHFRVARIFAKKRFQFAACVGEKGFVDKINRGSCAFDIQQNNADLRIIG